MLVGALALGAVAAGVAVANHLNEAFSWFNGKQLAAACRLDGMNSGAAKLALGALLQAQHMLAFAQSLGKAVGLRRFAFNLYLALHFAVDNYIVETRTFLAQHRRDAVANESNFKISAYPIVAHAPVGLMLHATHIANHIAACHYCLCYGID